MTTRKEHRRPSLATIVGSGLAVAAAGSLIAFSSLAEQAGLQGLAVGGIQPAMPGRVGAGRAITIPATEPPADPHEELAELVRRTVRADRPVIEPEPRERIVFVSTPPPRDEKEPRPDRIESRARVAVAEPEVSETPQAETDGPPYGHAYGHHKKRDDKAKKPRPEKETAGRPLYARTTNDDEGKPAKAPKMNKLEKVSKGKAKGHSKHDHAGGKGKGHSKHGH